MQIYWPTPIEECAKMALKPYWPIPRPEYACIADEQLLIEQALMGKRTYLSDLVPYSCQKEVKAIFFLASSQTLICGV